LPSSRKKHLFRRLTTKKQAGSLNQKQILVKRNQICSVFGTTESKGYGSSSFLLILMDF